jgi:inhibitor of KinA
MGSNTEYRIFPLGDAALTIDFGNVIDPSHNRKVLSLFAHLRENPLPGMIEAVPAYSSLTVYYDVLSLRKMPEGTVLYNHMKAQVQERINGLKDLSNDTPCRLMQIPVCYDPVLAPGLKELAATRNLSINDIIQIHTTRTYRVYMLGFLPGFAYMGEVDDRISIPRKMQPENVAAGSVGIAGKQTGIYPLASPGGWCIIGRTPLKLFDEEIEDKTLFRAGDSVQFHSISKDEFEGYQSRHS